jgi:HaeIII restriction endonuclease.
MPVLQAFHTEMGNLFQHSPEQVARGLVQYLLGRYDFYKVIKENGNVSIMSFNIDGTLKWGSRIPLPTRIIEISMKPHSDTTLIMTFDHGWQISFRIHNASTKVEPSLKFDINIIGLPQVASRHVISYG